MQVRQAKPYRERRYIFLQNSKCLLRFENENVDFITNSFLTDDGETHRCALENLSSLSQWPRLPKQCCIHWTTVCKTVIYIIDKITERSHHWITFPMSAEDMTEVIGAVVCTRIEIKKPTLFSDEYINLVLMYRRPVMQVKDSQVSIRQSSVQELFVLSRFNESVVCSRILHGY